MNMQNKQVVIIGGGPGGLTLARLLQLQHIPVKVVERDLNKEVRQQGATLDLHDDSGLKALAAAGLLDEFKAAYRPGADRMRITDAGAVIRFDDHAGKKAEDFGTAHFRPEIDRGPLRDLLIASLKEDTILWNSHFTGMEPSGEGWLLQFRERGPLYADLVIAADGANSKVRPYISSVQPVYSGITIVEGNIYHAAENAPQLHALVNGGKVFAFGDEKSIILSAKGEGSLSFYTGTKESEDWVKSSGIDFTDKAQLYHWFKERFAGWAPVWHELFGSGESYLVPRPMYHYPPGQTWETLPNATMIGDAAHRMPPYAGEGVNMAMLDALELAQALRDPQFSDLRAALSRFEKQMQQRTSEVTRFTLEQTENLHSKDALQNMLEMFSHPPKI